MRLSETITDSRSKYPPLKWGLYFALKGIYTGMVLKYLFELAYRTQASPFLLVIILTVSI